MLSRRALARLSALGLLGLTALVLLAAGACSVAAPPADDRVAVARAALDGPEKIWSEQQKLLCNDALPYSYFGWASAIDGTSAIVGAYRADHDRGAAYVFTYNGKKWVQQAKLTAGDGKQSDLFGGAVALEGDVAVATAPYRSPIGFPASGAAYVFERAAGRWTETAELVTTDAKFGSAFGWTAALSGDTIAVGSFPYPDPQSKPLEAVYVFGRDGSAWTQKAKLVAGDAKAGQNFGVAVAMQGDTMAIGASGDGSSGAVYVFERSGDTWTQTAKLKGSGAGQLGYSVTVDHDTIIAGAPITSAPKVASGAAYVFTRVGGVWAEEAKLTPHDPESYGRLGGSVAIEGDTAIVGRAFSYAPNDISFTDKGAAYVFDRGLDGWTETTKLTTPTDPGGIWFGNSVSIRGGTAFVGAVEYDVGGDEDQGALYVYALRGVQGAPCGATNECGSGSCVDGVCCDSPCKGACMACSAAKKGGGDDGVCEPVADGTDPDGDCSPYTCSAGACLASCDKAADCAKTFYCDPARHECASVPEDIGEQAGCSVSSGPTGGFPLGPMAFLFAAAILARRRARARILGLSALILSACGAGCDDSGSGAVAGAPRQPEEASPMDDGQAIAIEEQAELFASMLAAGDQLGAAVAISGDTAIVGVPFKDVGATPDAGGAYVFKRDGDAWAPEALLLAPIPVMKAHLGAALAISGDTAAVIEPATQSVYTFERANGSWSPAKIAPADATFTGAIALSGDTLVTGAMADGDLGGNAGAAHVIVRAGGAWAEETKLKASDGAEDDRFGAAVAVDGDTIVVGAIRADPVDTDSGAAYVFVRGDGGWMEQAKLAASDGSVDDNLGGAIAVSGDRVVLGVPAASAATGAAYVFARDASGAWTEEAKLTAGDGMAGDRFGASVAITGDAVIVGSPEADPAGADAGAIYVFSRINGGWTQVAEVTAEDGQPGDRYGASVAASGTTAIVGAPGNDLVLSGGTAMDVGSAYALLLGSPVQCVDDTHSAAARAPDEAEAEISDCAPRRCDPASGACRTACKVTADCAKGYFCDPGKRDCVRAPGRDLGADAGCRASAGDAPGEASPAIAMGLSIAVLSIRRVSRRRRRGTTAGAPACASRSPSR